MDSLAVVESPAVSGGCDVAAEDISVAVSLVSGSLGSG